MSKEEFIKILDHQREIRKNTPTLYDDVFILYERYKMLHTRNKYRLEILYYELENVKGVDYAKQKATRNEDARIEKYYSISEQISGLEKDNAFIENVLKGLEQIRDGITNKELRDRTTEGYFNVLYA